MAFDNEEYYDSQSGASLTRPEQCGKLRIGGHIVISGRPCKIMEMTKAKNGKHGSAKAHIIALDIFTDKKIEIISGTKETVEVPIISRREYQLLDIQADGFLSVFSPNGDTRTDLKLEEDEPISQRCRHLFDEGSSVAVWVLESMGEERICGVKELSD